MLHLGQVFRDSLPLLSPAFRRSHFCRQVPARPPVACTSARCLHVRQMPPRPPGASTSAMTRETLAVKGGTMGEKSFLVILPTWFLYSRLYGSFICRKSTTRDRRVYFPFEGRNAEEFFGLKNPTASAGFEPANLGIKASTIS